MVSVKGIVLCAGAFMVGGSAWYLAGLIATTTNTSFIWAWLSILALASGFLISIKAIE